MLKSMFDTDRLTVRLGIFFTRFGISPNAWTVISIIPAILGFVALSVYGEPLLGVALFALSGFIDLVDGAVARVSSRVSALGAFLDKVITRYVELLLYVGVFIFLSGAMESFLIPTEMWIILLVSGAFMYDVAVAYGMTMSVDKAPQIKQKSARAGVLEDTDRFLLVLAGLLLGYFEIVYLIEAIALAAVLSHITALQQIIYIAGKKRNA